MDELLVIDKTLDFIVPVKLRGKHMGVLMERGGEAAVSRCCDCYRCRRNLVEGYADRFAKYFNTMVHLGIVDNNL